MPAQLLVTSKASGFRGSAVLRRSRDAQVARWDPSAQGSGRKSMPDCNDFAPFDLVGQPVGDEEQAARKIVREFDELLGLFARISRRIERVDPDAVARVARVLDDCDGGR